MSFCIETAEITFNTGACRKNSTEFQFCKPFGGLLSLFLLRYCIKRWCKCQRGHDDSIEWNSVSEKNEHLAFPLKLRRGATSEPKKSKK